MWLNNHDIKMHRGVAVKLQPFLVSRLDGGQKTAASSSRFTTGNAASGILGIGDWMGPNFCLKRVVKRKSLFLPGIERTLVLQPWSDISYNGS
jgi:hypothetical protein